MALSNGSSVDGNTAPWQWRRPLRGGRTTVVASDVSANQSTHGAGGGIYARNGGTVSGSTINGNTAFSSGGGIYAADGGAIITGSTISLNKSTQASGGGIYANGGAIGVTSSTITNNSASNGGGIADNFGEDNSITLLSSTVSANTATANGGGILDRGDALSITTSTLSANTAEYGGGDLRRWFQQRRHRRQHLRRQPGPRAGGRAVPAGGVPSIVNSTFGANTANVQGGTST